jgi:hypothetical protein
MLLRDILRGLLEKLRGAQVISLSQGDFGFRGSRVCRTKHLRIFGGLGLFLELSRLLRRRNLCHCRLLQKLMSPLQVPGVDLGSRLLNKPARRRIFRRAPSTAALVTSLSCSDVSPKLQVMLLLEDSPTDAILQFPALTLVPPSAKAIFGQALASANANASGRIAARNVMGLRRLSWSRVSGFFLAPPVISTQ